MSDETAPPSYNRDTITAILEHEKAENWANGTFYVYYPALYLKYVGKEVGYYHVKNAQAHQKKYDNEQYTAWNVRVRKGNRVFESIKRVHTVPIPADEFESIFIDLYVEFYGKSPEKAPVYSCPPRHPEPPPPPPSDSCWPYC